MKRRIALLLIGTMALTLAACGDKPASNGSEGTNAESETIKDDTGEDEELESKEDDSQASISIEDIDWKVEEGIIDGDRIISFGYTNNTDYTIADVEMKFVQKDDVTPEQRAVFDILKEENSLWTDEDIEKMHILGYNRKVADPGETVGESPCSINGTYTRVKNMEQYDLMRPDTVSIVYIGKDDKLYMMYYDFNTKQYGSSTQGSKELYEWSDSELSSLLPKPEFRIVSVGSDDDDYFFFDAYGVSREEFNAYTQQCAEAGFTNVQFEGNDAYRAINADGYEVSLQYDAIDENASGSVEKSDIQTDNKEMDAESYEKQVEEEKEAYEDQVEKEKEEFLKQLEEEKKAFQ